jgi:glucosamine--fructose-6-phosphate aminotransferase (isomerizing)
MSEKYPNELFAFKKGPSLLIGLGEKELFLSSDVQVFLPYTRKVIFLQDGEVAHIKGESEFSCYSENGKKIEKRITVLDAKPEETDKEGYPYYMLKEIYEQPDCILKVIGEHIKKEEVEVNINKGSGILDQVIRQKRLNIVACGSSYYAALYGKYVIERFSRIFVEVDMASEFRYRFPILSDRVPVLLISQSGETADTLAVMKMFQELSLPVLSLCNVAHSSLDRGASANMYMLAGVEKGVASTKAFTSTLVTLFLLALDLGKKNGQLNNSDEKQLLHSLLSLPDQMEKILARTQEYVDAAHLVRTLNSFIYLGRDIYYPLALEGALKMKELTYRHAAAYPAGEMKHGPLALVDGDMAIVGLTPQSHVYKKTLSNLEEARSRGGKLILIGTKGDKVAASLSEYFLSIPDCNEYLSSILCVLPLQLMAYHTACAFGHNVDQPRNLAKSVTVE